MDIKKHYYSIDIAKLVCALLVIALHVNVVEDFTDQVSFTIKSFIYNLLVPFFFICSGYFFYQGLKKNKDYYKKYIGRISKIYLGWTAIYMPIILLTYLNNNRGFILDFLIFIRNFIFAGSTYHLWYLISLIYSIYIVSLFLRKNKFKTLFLLALLCLGFILWGKSSLGENTIISKLYIFLFGGINSGIVVGILFTIIGVLINKCNLIHRKYLMISMLIVGIYITFIVLAYYSIYYNYYITYIVSIGALIAICNILFNWTLQVPIKYVNKLGNINLTIYCLHVLVLIIITKLEDYFHISVDNLHIINFFLVTFITIISSICVEKSKLNFRKTFNLKQCFYMKN